MTMKRLQRWRYVDGELVCVGWLLVAESWKSERIDTEDNEPCVITIPADDLRIHRDELVSPHEGEAMTNPAHKARLSSLAKRRRGTYPLPDDRYSRPTVLRKKNSRGIWLVAAWGNPRGGCLRRCGGWPSLVWERGLGWLASRRDRRVAWVVECGLRP